MVLLFDVGLLEEAEHFLLELSAPFSRNNLDGFDPLRDGFFDYAIQFLSIEWPLEKNG